MASGIPPANEERRVKVYELRNHDWYDRGTGFCSGQIIEDEPMIVVKSEDEPIKTLLSTRISKDYEYQRQQETLIVWTDPATSEMALSFQEAEGCASIWEFVNHVQVQQSNNTLPDDALSDDALEFATPVMPPIPELSNLPEIEHIIRVTSQTAQGRDQLNKFLLGEEYIRKLLPLVDMAEDLESLSDLHRLNNIMKMFILLNDTQIVEYMVSDDVVMGVLAALEYDPEFPDKKATHRAYLKSKSRFKEVVPINNDDVKKKIHVTWRLQYLKDVVLARILDDPTFGVLNSLIFFNQVDIVNHLQSNSAYMKDLFAVVADKNLAPSKRKDAIVFIQQCCLLAKNLQTPARNTLYANFVANGLISVLTYALASPDAGTRHAGLEILVAMIDHDAPAVRAHIHMALKEKRVSLVDALTNLLHAERDLGAKAQTADAVKVLLDPTNNGPHNPNEPIRQNVIPSNGPGNGLGVNGNNQNGGDGDDGEEGDSVATQTQSFIEAFYGHSAAALFRPLQDLETVDIARTQFNFTESALQQYLIEILIFFVRHHHMRAKSFIGQQGLSAQIAKLLRCSSKHVALTAVKYFRTCLGLQDDFWFHEVSDNGAFGGILDILLTEATRGRDNLLNSACLEVFDQVRRDDEKVMIRHVVDNYRDRLEMGDRIFGGNGGGLDIFGYLIHRYEQVQEYIRTGGQLIGDQPDGDVSHHIHAQLRGNINGRRWQGIPEQDEEEENYFNTSDDEEGDDLIPSSLAHSIHVKRMSSHAQVNGTTGKSLVPYDDEDSDEEQRQRQVRVERSGPPRSPRDPLLQSFYGTPPDVPEDSDRPAKGDEQLSPSPRRTPESLSEKRKREHVEDEEEDTLGKMRTSKRRSSSSSAVSIASLDSSVSANGVSETRQEPSGRGLRSKKSLNHVVSGESGKGKKISITLISKDQKEKGEKEANEETGSVEAEKK